MNTDISVIIDMSGSMAGRESDTIGGFNAWLKETGKAQQQGDDVRISVTVFDTIVEQNVSNVAIKACPKLGTARNPYGPRGGTALLDAVGETLTIAKTRVKRGERGLALIITDGQENSSRTWTHAKLGALMGKLQGSKRWSFVYMGAGIDAWAQARTYNPNAVFTQSASYLPYQTQNAMMANGIVTGSFLRSASAQSTTLGAETTIELDKAKAKQKVGS